MKVLNKFQNHNQSNQVSERKQDSIDSVSSIEVVEIISNKLSETERKVLNSLLFYDHRYGSAWPSQARIAKEVGITREYCLRLIKKLVHCNLIIKTYRPRKTCIYSLNPMLTNPHVRSGLRHLLDFFRVLPLAISLLYSPPVHSIKKEVNRYINNLYIHPPGRGGEGRLLEKYSQKIYGPTQPLSLALRTITQPTLTLDEQCKLMTFPDGVITSAYEKFLKYKKPKRNPFAVLYALCQYEADLNSEKQFWQTYYWLKNSLESTNSKGSLCRKIMSDNEYCVKTKYYVNKKQESLHIESKEGKKPLTKPENGNGDIKKQQQTYLTEQEYQSKKKGLLDLLSGPLDEITKKGCDVMGGIEIFLANVKRSLQQLELTYKDQKQIVAQGLTTATI